MNRPALKTHDLIATLALSLAGMLLGYGVAASAAPSLAGDAAPATPAPHRAAPAAAPAASSSAAVPRVVAGVYRGTLGSNAIEMTLTQDKDVEDSVHGWYVLLGSAKPERVQLAGEWEDDTLSLEESHNGIDVSGNWSAIFNDDGFAGQWSDINGEHATDIALHRVKATTTTQSKP